MKPTGINSLTGPCNLFDDLKRRLEAGQSVTLNLQAWRKANVTIAGFHSKSATENLEDWAKWAGYECIVNPDHDTAILNQIKITGHRHEH